MNATLWTTWTRTVDAAPASVALIDAGSGRTWTRTDLHTAALAWKDAHGRDLARQAVAFAEFNGAGWLEVFLGVLAADGIAVPLDAGDPPATRSATALAAGASWLWENGALSALRPRPVRARDARRLIKLTSGSTGTPRALAFTDAEMLADGRQICAAMGIGADDRNLALIPWGHSYGLGNLILPLLGQGTALVAGVAPLPHAIAAAIAPWRVTVFPAVPALLNALAESAVAPEDLAGLRTVISAGAPLPPAVAQAFHARFARKVHSFYGSSETGGISYDATGDAALAGRSVGRPLPGVQLAFDRGRRIRVTSAAVLTLGNRHPGTQRLADLGRLDDAGEIVLLGRAGRSVKIAGRRLNLAEVEQALKRLPEVRDAFVMPHETRADTLAAAVATDRAAADLREALRERLASWKIPKKLVTLPHFPLTARGKTDTRQLRARLR